jgi:O-antigen ligase
MTGGERQRPEQRLGEAIASQGVSDRGLGRAASMGELGLGGMLIVAYLAITRIGHIYAAKIGFQIGPVPIFLTEMLILAMALTAVISRPAPIVCWLTTGSMTRAPGLMLWILFLTSMVYAVAAVGEWGVLALRDLAIFAYGMVFALAYIVLDTREKAAAAMRWFTYSGVILSLLLIGDTVSGAHVLFVTEIRIVTDQRLEALSFGGGDVGGIVSFSFIALLAYAVTTAERRGFHIVCACICLYALAITQTRSAAIGLFLALIYSLFGMRTTQRLAFLAVMCGAVLSLLVVPVLMPDSGLAHSIATFSTAVDSGLNASRDDNVYFRLLRWDKVFELWRESPLFGVGFGRPLIPASLLNETETGLFNTGLPHNTYLTVLARVGLFGFALIVGAWIASIVLATKAAKRTTFAGDAFAAGASLVAMLGYATFVLFLERPMHAATLWIVAAIACRLAGPDTETAPAAIPRQVHEPARLSAAPAIAHARRIALAKGFR